MIQISACSSHRNTPVLLLSLWSCKTVHFISERTEVPCLVGIFLLLSCFYLSFVFSLLRSWSSFFIEGNKQNIQPLFQDASLIIDGLIFFTQQCWLICLSLPPTPPFFFFSSIATMSGRWPASILSPACPPKTTASLSSTNSKSLVFAPRMLMGSISELCNMLLQLMCRQRCTSLCLTTFCVQRCLSAALLFLSYQPKQTTRCRKVPFNFILSCPQFYYIIIGWQFWSGAKAGFTVLMLKAE